MKKNKDLELNTDFFQDFNVDGVTIRKGQSYGVFIHYLHRNPKVWDNPIDFLPERFMEESCLG